MTLLFCVMHSPMISLIFACLCLCAVISVTCSEESNTEGKYELMQA